MVAQGEGDAADEAAAFFEFLDVEGEGVEAFLGEGGGEDGGGVGHDDGFAGGDEVEGEAFLGFFKGNFNFLEGELVDFLAGGGVKGFGAVGDGLVVKDGEGEVKVVEETVGETAGWVDDGAVVGGLGEGVELDELEVEGFRGEGLGFFVAAIAGAGEEEVAADEAVALTGEEPVFGDLAGDESKILEDFLGVGFFLFSGVREAGEDGMTVFDERPVGGIDAVLAVWRGGDLDDFYAGGAEGLDDGGMVVHGFGAVDGVVVIIWIDVFVKREVGGGTDEEFLVEGGGGHLDQASRLAMPFWSFSGGMPSVSPMAMAADMAAGLASEVRKVATPSGYFSRTKACISVPFL